MNIFLISALNSAYFTDDTIKGFWFGASPDANGELKSSSGDYMSTVGGSAVDQFLEYKSTCNHDSCGDEFDSCAMMNPQKDGTILFKYREKSCIKGNLGAYLCVPTKKRRRKRNIDEGTDHSILKSYSICDRENILYHYEFIKYSLFYLRKRFDKKVIMISIVPNFKSLVSTRLRNPALQ